ncbi:MAG: ATP-dependent RecD-like DNA helicase [Candidatus Fimivivens sp.]
MADCNKIQGIVNDVVYHAQESGFTVLELAVGEELITVTGQAVGISRGEEIIASGQFVMHPNYGRQLKANSFEQITPATAAAVLRYLSGGAVKGIGPVTASRIVAKFGDKTLDIMEKEPARLTQVRGISPQKAENIGQEYTQLLGMRAVMAFLSAHSIEPIAAVAMWKKWGAMARERINADPFCLCDRDVGVSFEKADAIAATLGVDETDGCRVRGGILHVLAHNLNNGHACLPIQKLVEACCRLLNIGAESVEIGVDDLCERGEVMSEEIFAVRFIYLPDQFFAEVYVAERLGIMMRFLSQDAAVTQEELAALERELGIRYAAQQQQAIFWAAAHPIMILTGGPGTGKTTTLNGVVTLFERRAMKVALAAPTGRAAKRLSEVTGREVKTIHRLLEVDFGSRERGNLQFKRNEQNPLPFDAVVVDEMSMVDATLFSSLLKAVRTTARLVLVGDPDQLPSVGAGNVLHDLIDSGAVACVHLNEVFRQAANSLIITSAHDIVSGQMPTLKCHDADFFFLPGTTQEQAACTVADLCARRLPKAYGYSPVQDIQVIAPTKQGAAGTIELNRMLQEALNPPDKSKCEHKVGNFLLREGDKVMQIRNNYDIEWQRPDGEQGLGVFNGDIGTVEMIDRPTRSVIVTFEDRRAEYAFDMLNELDLAYAITVHKSQGNEFDVVIIPLLGRHKRLHYRNLLYTAVTRAKKLLILVGHADTVAAMVENNRKTLRYTNLAPRIREQLGM